MSIYQMPRPETRQSVPDLIRVLFAEMTELIQQHIELTKTEVREEGQRLAKAAVFGVVGLIFFQVMLVFLGNIFLLAMLRQNLSLIGATAITMVLFLILTAVCVGLCIAQIKSAQNLLKQNESS